MREIWTLARRDFLSYFTSPIAYLLIAGFVFIMSFMFFGNLQHYNSQSLQFTHTGQTVSITDGIIRPLYSNMNVILLFLIPFITMRLFAEERRQHTLELLLTAPISLTQIILGKFLSGVLLIGVMLAFTLIYPAILIATGNPDLGPIFGSYLGTLLLAVCYLSVGLFFSALTQYQIIAGALTLSVSLFFWLIHWLAQFSGPVWSDVFEYLSLIAHFNAFSRGEVSTSDIVFYLSFAGLGLFLTHRALDSFRWRST